MAHPQITAREAAFLSLLHAWKENVFLADSLKKFYSPLAQEIAYGTMQRMLTLDAIAKELSTKKTLKLKLREKILLRMALYQVYFMNGLPLYAITNESVNLADCYCHSSFKSYLNAVLRRTPSYSPQFDEWSLKYSFPPLFITKLLSQVGKKQTEEILSLSNQPALSMFRKRSFPFDIEIINNLSQIPLLAESSDVYIQNSTPVTLMKTLASHLPSNPQRILDLCASPGGKLLLAHDLFPHATLFANDISQPKIKKLEENLLKYNLCASIHIGPGETYPASSFDLVIVDAPCSNTGVLNKRPEARWRLTKENLAALEKTQKKLLKRALELVSPSGIVWYMTCSILKEENEALIAPYHPSFSRTLYPDEKGADGGFGAMITSTIE